MRSRTRSTHTTMSGETICRLSNGTIYAQEAYGPFDTIVTNAYINDVVGKGRPMRPCSHENFSAQWSTGSYVYPAGVITCTASNISALAIAKGQAYYLHSDDFYNQFDWDAASGRAYAAMRPTLRSDLNMSVFLAEMRDLSSLFKLFDGRYGILKNLAGLHLNYSFGWKPLIRDLSMLFDRAVSWELRLQDYLGRQNVPQIRHYRENLSYPSAEYASGSPSSEYQTETVTGSDAQYTATMRYMYRVPVYSGFQTKVRAFLDTYGLNVNLSTVWELIPFSFVIDWFTGIGNWLESREDDWLDPVMEIQAFCHSLKYGYTIVDKLKRGGGSLAQFRQSTSSKYYRRVDLPNLRVELECGDFSPRRIALATSLLIQRF